jgi:hypothetical protein
MSRVSNGMMFCGPERRLLRKYCHSSRMAIFSRNDIKGGRRPRISSVHVLCVCRREGACIPVESKYPRSNLQAGLAHYLVSRQSAHLPTPCACCIRAGRRCGSFLAMKLNIAMRRVCSIQDDVEFGINPWIERTVTHLPLERIWLFENKERHNM